jgi:hypothetical protein
VSFSLLSTKNLYVFVISHACYMPVK